MQRELKPQKQNRIDIEQIMALLLLFFLLFEILLVSVTLIRCVEPKKDTEKEPTGMQEESTEGKPNDDPDTVPVFAGGINPPKPHAGESTKTLGEEITSEYAILVDCESGEILASKNADVRFSPASMTKVMTLIVACENLTAKDLARRVVYTQEIADYVRSGNYKGTSTSLPIESGGVSCIGDEYVLEDLLYGIGVASAADCTYMIAKEVAGSEEAFVELMNQKAAEMGLTNTHFDNAVGFDSANNYTTAGEMATIMSYAMQSGKIKTYLAVRSEDHDIKSYYLKDGQEVSYKVTLKNSLNSRLEKYSTFKLTTSKMLATKTGYTTESFMVVSAEGNTSKRQYILVLGEKDSGNVSLTQKFKNTMIDIEAILNTYVK